MQIIRLTTWIDAPADRCFNLATSAEFHPILAKPFARTVPAGGIPNRELTTGDRLIWPGRYLGLQLRYTTRIDLMRPCDYFREVLDTGCFHQFEHDHHFTPLNDGTRMRDEIRFTIPAGLLGPMTAPLARRYLVSRINLRNAILREVAESGSWHGYVGPISGHEDSSRADPLKSRSDTTPRVSTGRMAAHRS
jgi:ligand-binding SRPBCC domain-containing protein